MLARPLRDMISLQNLKVCSLARRDLKHSCMQVADSELICEVFLNLAWLQGMEVYSTVLWHLKKESALSHLAREAVAWDRRSPHAWAIMGNCFSLQKVLSG